MRAILLTLSLFVLCASNTSFLRELADYATIDTFTFTCNKGLTLPASFKAKTTADGSPAATSTGAVTLHLDGVAAETTTNDLHYECTYTISGGSRRLRNLAVMEVDCTQATPVGTAAYGTYKVTAMADKTDSSKKYGISACDSNCCTSC